MALALAPVGAAVLVAGILTVSLDGAGWKLAGVLVATLAVALLGVAWGLWRSAALSEAMLEVTAAEQRLDEVLVAAARSSGAAGDGKPQDSTCGSAGPACGSAGAAGGCGASCLTRSR